MAGGNFRFKEFTILQDKCAMKVGTDGVLLGAWARGGKEILDIGTGTGLIALMMAQRYSNAHVTAVELDHEAAIQAWQNAESSPFANRIDIIESDIKDYAPSLQYDCIVSNPPYFNSSLKAPDAKRSTARHTDSLSYRSLFVAVARLLRDDGEFSAIIPDDCLTNFVAEAYMAGMSPTRRTAIHTTRKKKAKRYLLAFSKSHTEDFQNDVQYIQKADGSRTEWYDELTKNFYIK